jgi:hypothetical protein
MATQSHKVVVSCCRLWKQVGQNNKSCEYGCIARKYGHKVVKLPPYYCHYSLVEVRWTQVNLYTIQKTSESIDGTQTSLWLE